MGSSEEAPGSPRGFVDLAIDQPQAAISYTRGASPPPSSAFPPPELRDLYVAPPHPWCTEAWPDAELPLWAPEAFELAATFVREESQSDAACAAYTAAITGLRLWCGDSSISVRRTALLSLGPAAQADLKRWTRAPPLGPQTTPRVWSALQPLQAPATTASVPAFPLSYPAVATIGGKFRATLASSSPDRFERAMSIAASDPFSTYSRFPLRASSFREALENLVPPDAPRLTGLPQQARAGAALGGRVSRVTTPTPASAAAVKKRAAAAPAAFRDSLDVGGPDSHITRPTVASVFGDIAPKSLRDADAKKVREIDQHYAELASIDEALALFPSSTLREFAALQRHASADPGTPFDPHGARSVLDVRAQLPGDWPANAVPSSVVFGILAEISAPHRHAIARLTLERRNAIRRAAGFPGTETILPEGFDPLGATLISDSERATLASAFLG